MQLYTDVVLLLFSHIRNPTATLDTQYTDPDHQIPCLGAYGGPIDPNTALGGFNSKINRYMYVYIRYIICV